MLCAGKEAGERETYVGRDAVLFVLDWNVGGDALETVDDAVGDSQTFVDTGSLVMCKRILSLALQTSCYESY